MTRTPRVTSFDERLSHAANGFSCLFMKKIPGWIRQFTEKEETKKKNRSSTATGERTKEDKTSKLRDLDLTTYYNLSFIRILPTVP